MGVRDTAEMFAALADPTRLAMLALLRRHGELCVCDIQGVLAVTQSRASRHLQTLRRAGLVDGRRLGAWVHYRVVDRPDAARKSLLDAFDRIVPRETVTDIDRRLKAYRRQA